MDRVRARRWGRAAKARRGKALRSVALEALEALEARTLLAVLPAPLRAAAPISISPATSTSHESSPTVVVDPTDPRRLVATWTRFDSAPPAGLPGVSVQAALSTDGGASWADFDLYPNKSADSPTGLLPDPTTTVAGPPVVTLPYTRSTDGGLGFDRRGNLYILTSQHDDAGTSGALVLNKYHFTGSTLVTDFTGRVVHLWTTGGDQVANPTIAVDDSVATFTDPDDPTQGTPTQFNPSAGNVYVAWAATDVAPANPPADFNPNRILLVASSDGGRSFSGPTVVNDGGPTGNSGAQRNARPRIAISQGTAADPGRGGQVTVIWDDFGTLATATPDPLNRIMADTFSGARGETFAGSTGPIGDNVTTPFTRAVAFANAGFNPTDLDVTVAITDPTLQQVRVVLRAPNGAAITLVQNQVDNTGTAITPAQGITGANLGILNGNVIGTTFDDQATRVITQGAAPFVGRFRPETGSLAAFLAAAKVGGLEGVWRLEVTDIQATAAPVPTQEVNAWSLNFTDGLQDLTGDREVTTTTVIGSLADDYALASAATPNGIGPGAVIAVDNTLGLSSSSPNQGRIYVAFTDRIAFTGDADGANPDDNTDIFLAFSDDGGRTWTRRGGKVNDDDSRLDGFSESGTSNFGDPPFLTGRPQFLPSIAVDQSTGALVMSWFDTRDDAARARVATYLTASIDGGARFSPQVFANRALAPTDVATGNAVVLAPIPDNQSAGNTLARETTFGFGSRSGLAVAGGRVYTAWAGNENGGLDGKATLDILLGRLTIPAGPRVESGTSGPVGVANADGINLVAAPDGSPQARSFIVTFDRPVDPDSFTTADVRLLARDQLGNPLAVQPTFDGPVVRLNGNANAATRFQVNFTPVSAPGTISYTVGPDIVDTIRRATFGGTLISPGNAMDQDADGDAGEGGAQGQDRFDAPRRVNPAAQLPFSFPYVRDTLGLVIPGPHVTGPLGNALNLDTTVGSIDVTFDRDMQVGQFTAADVLRIMGPAGELGQPLRFASTDVNHPTVDGATLVSNLVIDHIGVVTIADLDVRLDIDHTQVGDLTVVLVYHPGQPNERRITLAANRGGGGDHFVSTTFDDEASRDIAQGAAPFTGSFRPEAGNLLSAFDNLQLEGGWALEITDGGSGTTGTLRSWSLTARPRVDITVTPVNPVGNLARTFRVGFPAQQLSGTYTVELGPEIYSAAGYPMDADLNAGVDALRGIGGGATQERRVNSTNVPIVVEAAVGATTPAVVTSTIVVTENFLIDDVNLQLDIDFANDPDLEAYLVAPGGRRIRLLAGVGNVGSLADFDGTLFDEGDLANRGTNGLTIPPITNGGPPFSGRYRPQGGLGTAVVGDFDGTLRSLNGSASAGTYTLEVVNNSPTLSGTLNSWSLTFRKPVPNSGLGEPAADRTPVSFRIFTMSPTNTLASSTWTPLGPASIGGGAASSRISGIAVDPSDPSGNTVYLAGASGGVWKTSNFLTTVGQPTWIPLTDFGPSFSLNIGNIAVFGRNNDPNQSILFASTGEGDTNTPGAGILRSMDGGATWTVLDSTNNALPFGQRDHALAGQTSFAIAVDPKLGPSGVIVYAALGDGVWRSEDSGQNWQRVLDGHATDIALDPFSGTFDAQSNPNGNLQVIYAAIQDVGVYRSPSRGARNSWTLMGGGIGKPLLRDNDAPGTPKPAVPVTNPGGNPNGDFGRILLAKPALVPENEPDSQRKNLVYQGWLYAAVATEDGLNVNLYMTKDQGQNWTLVQINNQALGLPGAGGPRPVNPIVVPSNDADLPESIINSQNSYNISMTIDPADPNVVYIGARNRPGVTRVDITGLHDPHAFYLDSRVNDGGDLLRLADEGPVVLKPDTPRFDAPTGAGFDPRSNPMLNLLRDPSRPLENSPTVLVSAVASVTNSGVGARWIPFDHSIGGGDHHRMVAFRDPVTGHTRLIYGYDQGVATAVDAGGFTVGGIGTAASINGLRNGNLQISQFYYGAIQPSRLGIDADGDPNNLLYGASQDNGDPASGPDILRDGNLSWGNPNPGFRGGDGGGIATDQQGRNIVYQYFWPAAGGGPTFTEFLRVNGVGRASGLIDPADPDRWPDLSGSGNNIAVNPLNGDQALISSFNGRLFRTQDQAQTWLEITPKDAAGDYVPFPGGAIRALAYGAPDPAVTGGSTDDFIYVGTGTGQVFVTTDGGATWAEISGISGGADALNGRVMTIVTNPARGSHEAYAVTTGGVYHMPDALAAGARWTDITGAGASSVFQVKQNIFGDPDLVDNRLKPDTLKALQVDWRYTLPDDRASPDVDSSESTTSPIIYVGGEGGVFRSTDNGRTWRSFPSAEPSSLSTTPTPPGDGGGLPNADVRDLDVSLGKIDPVTGRPVAEPGDPNLLVAFTYGRGAFGIRLAPVVLAELLALDPKNPNLGVPGGDVLTDVRNPFLAGFSQQSAFGSTVNITLYDLTNPTAPRYIGGYKPGDESTRSRGLTDASGRLVHVGSGGALVSGVRILSGLDLDGNGVADDFDGDGAPDAFLPDGKIRVGVQASDQSGTVGNMALFDFTLDITAPAAPDLPILLTDSGVAGDNVTNVINPSFLVGSDEPTTTVVSLLRNGQPVGTSNGGGTIQDTGPVRPDGVYQYRAFQVDLVGHRSTLSATLSVTIDTTAPDRPAAPALHPDDDSGVKGDNTTNNQRPRLTGTVEPGATVQLIDADGAVLATTAANSLSGAYTIRPGSDLVDGSYALRIIAIDAAGNPSQPSPELNLTIDTGGLGAITLEMVRVDDSGVPDDNRTRINPPRFTGTATPGLTIELLDVTAGPNNPVLLTATGVVVADNGTWLARPDRAFTPDGLRRIRARARDDAGNVALSPILEIFIDTTAPDDRPTLRLRPQDDTGRPGDNTTVRRRPFFEGEAEAGAIVELFTTDGKGVQTVVATGTADPAGRFSLRLASNLLNGRIGLQARVRDITGNVGAASDLLRVTIASVLDDFDNDGKADPVIFRPANGLWSIVQSTAGPRANPFGQAGDIPIRGDFDGDGKADLGVYRPSTAQFLLSRSTAGPLVQAFGDGLTHLPVIGDFDGADSTAPAGQTADPDGKTDIALFAPNSGRWFIIRSREGAVALQWGQAGDIPIPGDYDGDGTTDLAVYRPSTGQFFIRNSHDGTTRTMSFGRGGNLDTPIPGDYDGDGKTDIAVYWPEPARFLVSFSGGSAMNMQFGRGGRGDVPIVDDYNGDGKTDVATYWPDRDLFLIAYSGGGALVVDPDPQTTPPAETVELPIQAAVQYLKANSLPAGGTTRSLAVVPAAASAPAGAATTGSLNFGKTAATLAAAPAPAAAEQAPAPKVVTRQAAAKQLRQQRLSLAAIRRNLARHRAAARRFGR